MSHGDRDKLDHTQLSGSSPHSHHTEAQVRMGQGQSSFPSEPWPPSFANGLKSPEYTVLDCNEGFEVREYVTSKWVTTELQNVDMKSASSTMFWKLFKYIGGENEAKKKIPMTCPVITKITPSQGPACESTFAMNFFLEPEEGDAPQPTNTEVKLTELPKMKVYIRKFSGFASTNDWLREAEELTKLLPSDTEFEKDYWYTVGYDSPFRLMNRRNEVWFIGK